MLRMMSQCIRLSSSLVLHILVFFTYKTYDYTGIAAIGLLMNLLSITYRYV